MNSDAAIMYGLSLVSAMLCVGLLLYWRTLDGVRHALIWAAAFGLGSVQWAVIGGYNSFWQVNPVTFLGTTWLGSVIAVLLCVGFRERVGAPRRLGLALASITLTAALIVGFNAVDLSQISLAVPQFSRTIALPIAALTLIGPGRSANPIEKMGALVLIVFALFSTLVGGLRLADCGCDTNGGRATLLIGLPVLFIGTGLVAVLIMAADLAHQLRGVARLDPLTEALNRRGFEEAASRALMRMRRQERASTLVLLDLDHFKSINDRFGHARGDDVLQAVAQCVRREIRDADLFSRIGGEEFAILLDGSDVPTAFAIAERIRKAILALPCLPDREPITASFGIAPIGSESLLIPAMAQADLALYQAKSLGRNRSCVYAPESAQEATTRQMQTFAGKSA